MTHMLFYVGCVGRVVCSNDDSLDRLVSILSSVLAQIPVEAGGRESIN